MEEAEEDEDDWPVEGVTCGVGEDEEEAETVGGVGLGEAEWVVEVTAGVDDGTDAATAAAAAAEAATEPTVGVTPNGPR